MVVGGGVGVVIGGVGVVGGGVGVVGGGVGGVGVGGGVGVVVVGGVGVVGGGGLGVVGGGGRVVGGGGLVVVVIVEVVVAVAVRVAIKSRSGVCGQPHGCRLLQWCFFEPAADVRKATTASILISSQNIVHTRTYHSTPYLLSRGRTVPWRRRLVAGFPLLRPGDDPRLIRMDFIVDKVTLGRAVLPLHRFCSVFTPPVFHTHCLLSTLYNLKPLSHDCSYLINVCHLWILPRRVNAALVQISATCLSSSDRRKMLRKLKESPVCVCLPSPDLLRSHDPFILVKPISDVSGRSVLLGTSNGQVHESWKLDDSDQQTFGRCTVGD